MTENEEAEASPWAGFELTLRAQFGDRARATAPLAPLTTFRVGGPAYFLVEPRTSD